VKIKHGVSVFLIGVIGLLCSGCLYAADYIKNAPQKNNLMPHKFLVSSDLPSCRDYLTADAIESMSHDQVRQIEQCAYHFLETEDYASLESAITYLRKNNIRAPSGYWLQTNFYVGLEKFADKAVDDASYDEMEAYIKRWIEKSGGSNTARLELSHIMLSRAAFYRGDGYANTISEQSFEKHYQQVSRAKKYLLENESIGKTDPEWFYQMLGILNVERNTDETQHKKLFEQAIKLYPDYYPIYFTASEFHLAKWHGDNDSFEKFARQATAGLEPGHAKAIYARIYRNKICGRCGDKDVRNWRDHWEDINAGMEQVIKEFPDQWNFNTYAHMACSAYDQDKTLELMQRIKDAPIDSVWNDRQFSYEYCANWSGLNQGAK